MKMDGKNYQVDIEQEQKENGKNEIFIRTGRRKVCFEGIEGLYPMWRQCVPATPMIKIETWDFDIDLLWGFSKAVKIMEPRSRAHVRVRAHEPYPGGFHSPYSILIGSTALQFYGVLMPLAGSDRDIVPEWAKLPKKPEPTPEIIPAPAA